MALEDAELELDRRGARRRPAASSASASAASRRSRSARRSCSRRGRARSARTSSRRSSRTWPRVRSRWRTACAARATAHQRLLLERARHRRGVPSGSAAGRASVMVAGGAEATDHARRHRRLRGDVRALAAQRRARRGRAARGTRAATASSAARARASSCSSRSPARKKRGARIYAEITGYGASSDAYHLTKPAPDGEGAQRAMQHGARGRGARAGPDRLHQRARHLDAGRRHRGVEGDRPTLFGEHATDKKLWVSSTKSMMGHLLGAAGAVEARSARWRIADGHDPADDQPRRSGSGVRRSTTCRSRRASGACATR